MTQEENNRDKLWCVAILNALSIDEVHAVTSEAIRLQSDPAFLQMIDAEPVQLDGALTPKSKDK